MRVMNLNKLIFLQLRGPEGKKIPKAISDFGVDNSKYTIISLRTVAALRKQSCGLFLAVPQELCSEDPKSTQKETPK